MAKKKAAKKKAKKVVKPQLSPAQIKKQNWLKAKEVYRQYQYKLFRRKQ